MSTYESSDKFFQEMISLYKTKDSKSIIDQLKGLFSHGYELQKSSWDYDFNFNPYTKVDNMCGTFFNILEAIQEWQICRLSGIESLTHSFESYLLVLEMSLAYLDMMGHSNEWFSPCIKYLVLKSKSVMKEANNAGADNITTASSLQKLVQRLRDFKSSKNIGQETKKNFQLMINNLLVSCYLSIRDYTKSKKLINDKEIQRDLSSFSKHEINNYLFQAARLDIYERSVGKAIASLEAIKFTTRRQRHLILKYLIPCNLYNWKVFKINQFPEYTDLSQAVIAGNFGRFTEILIRYKLIWIKRGIYELILGLQSLVWRNFLKRLQKYSQCETMSIAQIALITQLMGGKFSSEDCLFHVTNLIQREYLKAHIYVTSDGQKTLVFKIKKGDVFPKRKPQ